jgi:hypothetical protein
MAGSKEHDGKMRMRNGLETGIKKILQWTDSIM